MCLSLNAVVSNTSLLDNTLPTSLPSCDWMAQMVLSLGGYCSDGMDVGYLGYNVVSHSLNLVFGFEAEAARFVKLIQVQCSQPISDCMMNSEQISFCPLAL